MSVQALGWVLDHSPARAEARLVLISIANHAGQSPHGGAWEAWPGLPTIQREAGLASERTTTNVLSRLVADGALQRIVNGAPDERIDKRYRTNLYRVLLSHGVSCSDERCRWCDLGVSSDDTPRAVVGVRQGVSPDDAEGCSPTTAKPSVEPSLEPSETRLDSVEPLCALLADRIENYQGGNRPRVTQRWRRDMRLLVERGPLHIAQPDPKPPDNVERCIAFVFDKLADPDGRSGFCWASVVRSPGALRDHWLQIADAGRRLNGAATSAGARAVDRAAERMGRLQLLRGGDGT